MQKQSKHITSIKSGLRKNRIGLKRGLTHTPVHPHLVRKRKKAKLKTVRKSRKANRS